MQLSESDYEVLRLEAEAKGVTVEQLLQDYGHLLQPTPAPQPPEVPVATPQPAPQPAPKPSSIPNFEVVEIDEYGNEFLISGDAMEEMSEPAAPELPPELPETPPESLGTVAAAPCPHCGISSDVPVDPVPTYEDKLLFLHCLLGDQVFKKSYTVFGGRVRFAYRMLRTTELDYLYQEAFRAQRRGILNSPAEYYAFIGNLRVYVQLAEIATSFGLQLVLPAGLTKAACPEAASTWDVLCPEDPENPELTLIDRIQRYINREVFKTEAVMESARELCGKFNRLVATLEMNKNNDPFWNMTDTPP